MSKRMLIDAVHAEETRVAVVDGTRVEDFDFESQSKKQLRGNIYLAKVTRVEPSLQAAFIEYGGNRHGFLAFNEIHPDYYQIPHADREALLREEEAEAEEYQARGGGGADDDDDAGDGDDDDDVMGDELARRNRRLMRRYKIQEVIKRRQIMLIQVVKEERGNKGAALTTYLSLAGRYGVLMPNTARGGGISRKITTVTDRKRLKGVVQSLDVPQGMGLIVRTAGAKRTKAELKRDYEYLMRLWESIRDRTLHSVAPALIYEEEDLVKRAIRDMFDKDLEGIWVEGEEGYREARDFMRMIMPSQAKKVIAYRDPTPLFVHAKIEDHLAQIYSPVVPLKSGGYLVINQTEALVAIDVNSGKSTRERNIEATAVKTNTEAAEEAARQLRLRDLAGLIVIDFIDMEEAKNNRSVEKVLKDALKDDRARIQMGKISSFGLMEISRQRRRTGVLEGTTHVCEHCQGTGRIRSTESSALAALRAVELEAVRGGAGAVILRTSRAVGLYILNDKRPFLERLRVSQGLVVTVVVDDALSYSEHGIERTETREFEPPAPAKTAFAEPIETLGQDEAFDDEDEEEEIEEDEDEAEAAPPPRAAKAAPAADVEDRAGDERGDSGQRRGRRRRRRGGRRDDAVERPATTTVSADTDDGPDGDDEPVAGESAESAEARNRRRRRGRRGGRRVRDDVRRDDPYTWSRPRVPDGDPYIWMDPAKLNAPPAPVVAEASAPAPIADIATVPVYETAEQPVLAADAPELDVWVELPAPAEPEKKPARARRSRAKPKAPAAEAVVAEPEVAEAGEAVEPQVAAAEVPPPPTVEPAPPEAITTAEPVAVAATPEPEPETVSDPVAGVSPEPAPQPALVAPDAAEISSPPEKPKRGWWRRGG